MAQVVIVRSDSLRVLTEQSVSTYPSLQLQRSKGLSLALSYT